MSRFPFVPNTRVSRTIDYYNQVHFVYMRFVIFVIFILLSNMNRIVLNEEGHDSNSYSENFSILIVMCWCISIDTCVFWLHWVTATTWITLIYLLSHQGKFFSLGWYSCVNLWAHFPISWLNLTRWLSLHMYWFSMRNSNCQHPLDTYQVNMAELNTHLFKVSRTSAQWISARSLSSCKIFCFSVCNSPSEQQWSSLQLFPTPFPLRHFKEWAAYHKEYGHLHWKQNLGANISGLLRRIQGGLWGLMGRQMMQPEGRLER